MLEGYVHALLKSVLGTYVDLNEDSEALRLSVWKGQVELRDLSLKVDAFEPYLINQPFAVACGCIGFLKLQVPLINLGSSPIQVHIQDVMLLLRPRQELAHQNTNIKESTKAMAKEYLLQAKRTTLQALEQEGKQVAPAQSTFFSRLLTKLLDNLQIQIERLHIRIEDTISYPTMPFSLGITLDEMIIKSIDASGKYTLQVRDKAAASCLRKRFELARFGVYFTPHYHAVTDDANVGSFLSQMHGLVWHQQPQYMVQPVTISINLIMNDRGVNMPMTSQAFSQRIMQRLGIVWMRDTIDAITPERWQTFVDAMPILANGKSYTLSFVFCEAWSLALDDVDVDEVPTLEEFQAALCSCFQWSNVDDLSVSTKLFHAAALRVLQENNTFLTMEMTIDHFAWRLDQLQYHSLLSLLSSISSYRQRQIYKDIRPSIPVTQKPSLWWKYAIQAVMQDRQKQQEKIDWQHVRAKNKQKARYKELYILLNDGSKGTQQKSTIHWGEIMREFDDLEYAMDNQDILLCRAAAKKTIAKAAKQPESSTAPPPSMWSYNYWFGTGSSALTSKPSTRPESPRNKYQDLQKETQYLYDAIDFNPSEDASMAKSVAASNVHYRVEINLRQCSVQLLGQSNESLLQLNVTDMLLQYLGGAKSTEMLMELSDFVLSGANSGCSMVKLPMSTICTLPDANEMSAVQLESCEAPLPLLSCKIDLPPLDDAPADIRLSLTTQPIDVKFHLPFLLNISAFFRPPPSVDLSQQAEVAWDNAKSFTNYSAAQIRQAISQRMKLKLQMDVTSPIVTLIEKRSKQVKQPVHVTFYFGHLHAVSHVQENIDTNLYERSIQDFLAQIPEEQLHDVIELSLRGTEVRLNDEIPLLERTNMSCTLKNSVIPDDASIPLVKIHGRLDRVQLHISSTGYDKVNQLLDSFYENLESIALPSAQVVAPAIAALALSTTMTRTVDTDDFLKLLTRVTLDASFTVGELGILLYEGQNDKLIRVGMTGMNSQVLMRNYDKRFEFGLESLTIENFTRPQSPFMVKSSETESLIRMAITMVNLDRPTPTSESLWKYVEYEQSWGKTSLQLWNSVLQCPLSLDVALDALYVEVHRDMLARLLTFFSKPAPPQLNEVPEINEPKVVEPKLPIRVIPIPNSPLSQSQSCDTSSYKTAGTLTQISSPTYMDTLQELIAADVTTTASAQSWAQLQFQFKSLELVLLSESTESPIATCSVDGLYTYIDKSPQVMGLAASLENVLILDSRKREIVSFDESKHIRISDMSHPIHGQNAMLTMAYQSYGIENMDEPWHPGYTQDISLCLRSPRLCFVYCFLLELQLYATTGPIIDAMASLWPRSQQVNSNGENSGNDYQSSLPRLMLHIHDSVVKVPRHSTSQDIITLHEESLRLTNYINENENINKDELPERLKKLSIACEGVCITTTMEEKLTSLLGHTNFEIGLNIARGIDINITTSAIRFVCSQAQYMLLLSAPFSNLNETLPAAPTSTKVVIADEAPMTPDTTPRTPITCKLSIPEMTMELCNGNTGYEPTSRGDFNANGFFKDDLESICKLHSVGFELQVLRNNDVQDLSFTLDSFNLKDSRQNTIIAEPYRSVLSLFAKRTQPALSVSLSNNSLPELLNSANISTRAIALPSEQPTWKLDIDLGGVELYPSSFLYELGKFFVQESTVDSVAPIEQPPNVSTSLWRYPSFLVSFTFDNSSIVLVEDKTVAQSRLLRLQWNGSVQAHLDEKNIMLNFALYNVRASSKLQDIESDGILKPFSMVTTLTHSIHSLSIDMKMNNIMALRCGYMDYMALCGALSELAPPQANTTGTIPVAMPSLQLFKKALVPRYPVCYGDKLVKLLLYNPRGYMQSIKGLGYYSGHWRKYMMMPPVPVGYESSFEEMTFELVPARSSIAKLGDPIRFGDTIALQDANGIAITKYDAIGATGYLGPEGSGGLFECRIWQAGTTIFNSDRTIVHYGDSIELEGITLYNPKQEVALTRDVSEKQRNGGGYLMFNGMGDAPVVFKLNSEANDATERAHLTGNTSDTQVISVNVVVAGIRLTVLNDMNNMHLPLLHGEVLPLLVSIHGQKSLIDGELKASALLNMATNLQAYNKQLAVWEPIVEDFEVNLVYHKIGGVVCDACLYQEDLPTCPSQPPCAFSRGKMQQYTAIARRSYEAKQQINRDLLQHLNELDNQTDTLLLSIPQGIAINISRNNLQVLFHGIELFTQEITTSTRVDTFGPNVYVDNQSGILLSFAMPVEPSLVDTDSSSKLLWTPVATGTCVATTMLAHEAPAGICMAPLRRLIWLKEDKKPMLVPIEHGHKSCIQFQSGQPLIAETVADKGTLILRLRSAVRVFNALNVPVLLKYDVSDCIVQPGEAAYVPVQTLNDGHFSLCPQLEQGTLDQSPPLPWNTLINSAKKCSQSQVIHQLTFFWHTFPISQEGHLPPYNIHIVASLNDLEMCFALHAPLALENLLPWPTEFTLVHESPKFKQDAVVGTIVSGDTLSMCTIDMRQDVSIAMQLAVPTVKLGISLQKAWIFGSKALQKYQYLTLSPHCIVVVDIYDPLLENNEIPSRNNPVACRLYCEYWFIDRTNLNLYYETANALVSPQYSSSDDFGDNVLSMTSQCTSICVKRYDETKTKQWTSTTIDLSAIGTRAALLLQRTNTMNVGGLITKHISNLIGISEEKTDKDMTMEYALGIRIDQGPGRFSRTTLVTFNPRYLVVNQSISAILEITQEGTNNVISIAPGARHFVHWQTGYKHRIQVRLINEKTTMWTQAFEMDAIGDFKLKMHAIPPAHNVFPNFYAQDSPYPHILHVAIQLQEPTMVVILRSEESTYDHGPIPYLIRNDCSRFRAIVWQKESEHSSTYRSLEVLEPLTTLAYTPDEPRNNPTVCIQLQSTLLYDSVKELEMPAPNALVNIEIALDKPHRLPVIQIGKRRVWVEMQIEGTTKLIVITDILPGASDAHVHKQQSMLLKDWKHILRRIGTISSIVDDVPECGETKLTSDKFTLSLWVLEARRLASLLVQPEESFKPFIRVIYNKTIKDFYAQNQALMPIWLPQELEAFQITIPTTNCGKLRIEIRDSNTIFGSSLYGFVELDLAQCINQNCFDIWCPLKASSSNLQSPASVHLLGSNDSLYGPEAAMASAMQRELELAKDCRDRFQIVLEDASLDVNDIELSDMRGRLSSFSSTMSTASDDTLFDEKMQLIVAVMHVTSYMPLDDNYTYYCAVESDLSTRCTTPALPKDEDTIATERLDAIDLEFNGLHALGLDLVYADGQVHIHGIQINTQSGIYYKKKLLDIGDRIEAVNKRSILNLSKDAAFAAIENAREASFSLTVAPTKARAKLTCVEWNRRLTFTEAKRESYLKVLFFRRKREKDHGLNEEKEASVLPFLYFFGEDAILDDLDHSKQHRQKDELLAMCWARVPEENTDWVRLEHAHEHLCALYKYPSKSDLDIIGHIQLALRWELIKPEDTIAQTLQLYAQIEIGSLFVSLIDSSEVVLASLSGTRDIPGIQLSYGALSDNRQVINFRLDHIQFDNQIVETNYPVMLAPVRVDSLPTFQFMAVVNVLPSLIHFEYIFAQLQELEIKVEDFLLVAIAKVFSNIDWSIHSQPAIASMATVHELLVAQNILSELNVTDTMLEANKKVVLRWLLLCPIKLNVTFTTTDQPLTHSILSPQMSPLLRNIIGAATALVTNLDRAPIQIPEFYIESVFETKYALGFYIMQHYLHHGLRSWYKIVGSVDVLGNPIGLVSTLGAGVKDFFFTPAQMLLEDESGLRIENLRTGMTKGSKSLLRNTAVGIFHATGKITETLGKGIAMLAMDNDYNTQRQQRALKQATTINHLGDGIVEGGKDLAGGIWDGVRGVVMEPAIGAANDGAGGFIVGLGKGFAGLVVKPTAGVLDLLTNISHGVKVTAESIDSQLDRRGIHRVRLPRRFGSDGVLVPYSYREAKGCAIMLLTGLEDDYIYHVEYGDDSNPGIVLLTDKRIACLSKGHQLWELARDSTLLVEAQEALLKVTAGKKLFSIPCKDAVALKHFQIAVESMVKGTPTDTRYRLLNLEKSSQLARQDEESTSTTLIEKVILELSQQDLQSQPIRSIRIELCHIDNMDARAKHDVLVSFSIYRLLVLGGPYQWTVFRRFSEFRELHEKLMQHVDMSSLPALPSRHLILSTRASVVKSRQEALSLYLQAVIMHPSILHRPEMLHFLTHDASDIHVAHMGLP